MTTALFVISLFFLVLSTIGMVIAWLCCGAVIRVLHELQAMQSSAKAIRDGAEENHPMPQDRAFMAWLQKNGINN